MFANLGMYHPQVVHFVIVLLIMGVVFRLISLTGKLSFTGPAATTLIILGTLAAQAALITGDKASGPVERIPGVQSAVQGHEKWADRTRNIFVVISLLEIAGLVLLRKGRPGTARGLWVASALVGLAGLGSVYKTGEKGGAIVYGYAGGPGIRSGNPSDVKRLLVSGLYNEAMLERRQGQKEEAARHFEELTRLIPKGPLVQLLAVESQLHDRQNPRGALDALAKLPATTDPRQRTRRDMVRVEAYTQLGNQDSARAIMNQLKSSNPSNPFVKRLADSLHL